MGFPNFYLGVHGSDRNVVSKLGSNLLMGLTTYLYLGYNPLTKYQQDIPVGAKNVPPLRGISLRAHLVAVRDLKLRTFPQDFFGVSKSSCHLET